MKAAIISLGSTSSKWTLEEMQRVFDEVDALDLNKFEISIGDRGSGVHYNGEKLEKDYDCIYLKGSFRYTVPMQILSQSFTDKGACFMPTSPRAFSIAQNKVLTAIALEQAKVPIPKTYITSTVDEAKKVMREMHFPIIMKFPSGTQGKGVMVSDSYASACSMLDALDALNQFILIQEYLETGGKDIRAFVVGDRVVACMERQSAEGDIRANIHAGGEGKAYDLDGAGERIAIEAAKAIGAQIAGVDLLRTSRGYAVLEVNLSPGLQGITAATKVNVAEKIAKFLRKKTEETIQARQKKDSRDIFQHAGIGHTEKQHHEMITTADLRGNKLLLPEIVTKLAKLSAAHDIVIRIEEGKITIEKF